MTTFGDFNPKNNVLNNISDNISNTAFFYHAENEGMFQNYSDLFPEGFNMTWCVPRWNSRGWGVIHYRYRLGGKVYRGTTHLKVKKDYWSKGDVTTMGIVNPLERLLHINIKQCQEKLNNLIISKILCNSATVGNIPEIITNTIKEHLNMNHPKKKECKSITLLMRQAIERHTDKETTKQAYNSKVDVLKRFFKERNLTDDVKSINQKTIRQFRDYLCERNSVVTAKNTFGVVANWLSRVEQDNDNVRFGIDYNLIPKFQEKTSREEKRNNGIALTLDEIEIIKRAECHSDIQRKYRDLFVLQCQTGIRFEDFPRLLNSKNHIEKEGIIYASFDTEKKGSRANIPLNSSKLHSDTLSLMREYIDDKEVVSLKNAIETTPLRRRVCKTIKSLATELGISRPITETMTKGDKVIKNIKPLFEKISTHDARRTFITNCIREFKLTPTQLIGITGHSTTTMIDEVYTILTKGDKLNKVADAIKELKPNFVEVSIKNDRGISSKKEGDNILFFLGNKEIGGYCFFECV